MLDNHRLAEFRIEHLRGKTRRKIRRSTGRRTHDDPDILLRIGLGVGFRPKRQPKTDRRYRQNGFTGRVHRLISIFNWRDARNGRQLDPVSQFWKYWMLP